VSTLVYRNAMLWVNAVDLSPWVHDLALNYSADSLEVTAMGDDTHKKKGGLYNWSIDVTFHGDMATGAVDATLFPLLGTTSCVEVRPLNSCSTQINPRYFGVGLLTSYPPLGGAVGTILDTKAHWDSAGTLGRSTTAT
jgi:hypothetical protein